MSVIVITSTLFPWIHRIITRKSTFIDPTLDLNYNHLIPGSDHEPEHLPESSLIANWRKGNDCLRNDVSEDHQQILIAALDHESPHPSHPLLPI
jgi:hypothetical protein